MKRILLIEDEKKMASIVKETLALYGYEVFHALDGTEGIRMFNELRPELVIADIMMPGMDGFQTLAHLRKADGTTPVLIVTARIQTADLVKAFEMGCNDYMKKPFVMEELLVRTRALLCKGNLLSQERSALNVYKLGRFIFYVPAQELRSHTQVHKLSFKESEILKRFCSHPQGLLERSSLLLDLWGNHSIFSSRNLNVYINKLRNYFKEDPDVIILNIRSIGYKLVVRNQQEESYNATAYNADS